MYTFYRKQQKHSDFDMQRLLGLFPFTQCHVYDLLQGVSFEQTTTLSTEPLLGRVKLGLSCRFANIAVWCDKKN